MADQIIALPEKIIDLNERKEKRTEELKKEQDLEKQEVKPKKEDDFSISGGAFNFDFDGFFAREAINQKDNSINRNTADESLYKVVKKEFAVENEEIAQFRVAAEKIVSYQKSGNEELLDDKSFKIISEYHNSFQSSVTKNIFGGS